MAFVISFSISIFFKTCLVSVLMRIKAVFLSGILSKNAVRSSATDEHFRLFLKTVDSFTPKRHLYAIIN